AVAGHHSVGAAAGGRAGFAGLRPHPAGAHSTGLALSQRSPVSFSLVVFSSAPVWRRTMDMHVVSSTADAELELLRTRFANVEQRIAEACRQSGRDPAEVRLLPVTKTVPAERLALARQLGYRWFGENR